MARALHCSTRSVRRWSAGSWPVPMGVEHDVELLMSTRMASLQAMSPENKRETAENTMSTNAPVRPPRWMIDEERAKLARNEESFPAKR